MQEYYDLLEAHDWYYQYSDDHRVWRRGTGERDTLKKLSALSLRHRELFEAYYNHMDPADIGGPKYPKPERPK